MLGGWCGCARCEVEGAVHGGPGRARHAGGCTRCGSCTLGRRRRPSRGASAGGASAGEAEGSSHDHELAVAV
eukprot:scaffold134784_cov32-Tisochrysis_lutea.AAC.2